MSSKQHFFPITLPAGRFLIVLTVFNGEETVDRERFTKAHLEVYAHAETGFSGAMALSYQGATYRSMHATTHYSSMHDSVTKMEAEAFAARERSYLVARSLLDAVFPATSRCGFHLDSSRWLAHDQLDLIKDFKGLSRCPAA